MSALVTAAQAGIYRQIAHKLRIQGRRDLNGPEHAGTSRGATSETNVRPRERGGRYLDSDAAPTLIELRAGDPVDVESLLRSGALQPWTPPVAAVEEVAHGEGL